MSSIDVPDELMARLIRAANRRGYNVDRNDQSQLADYIAYLLDKDVEKEPLRRRRNTLPLASGLLLRSDQPELTDAEIGTWLDERRTRKWSFAPYPCIHPVTRWSADLRAVAPGCGSEDVTPLPLGLRGRRPAAVAAFQAR